MTITAPPLDAQQPPSHVKQGFRNALYLLRTQRPAEDAPLVHWQMFYRRVFREAGLSEHSQARWIAWASNDPTGVYDEIDAALATKAK